MRVALVLHGDSPSPRDLALLPSMDAVVCADGGALPVLAAGIQPTHVVGDFDSLGDDRVPELRAAGVAIDRFPSAKDETDGELALAAALAQHPDQLTILGGHGGRTAMFLGALKLMRRAHDTGVDAVMVGQGETIRFVSGGERADLGGPEGSVDVVPVDGDAVVELVGCRWSGRLTLHRTESRGVSNYTVSEHASLSVMSGTVLLVLS